MRSFPTSTHRKEAEDAAAGGLNAVVQDDEDLDNYDPTGDVSLYLHFFPGFLPNLTP